MGTITHPNYTPIAINSRVETDEVLGPLPEHWEKSLFEDTGRHYYVNHSDQTTTWIDPRTYHIRKHNIDDIVAGELPYGWEESFDEQVGIFYIDHLTQSQFLDAPWDPAVREEIIKLRNNIENPEELENEENEFIDVDKKISELEGSQGEIEQEGRGIYNGRLNELKQMNSKLDSENNNLLKAAQETNDELEQVRAMIEAEAEQRLALEEYINKLKNDVMMMADPDLLDELKREDDIYTQEAQEELRELEERENNLLDNNAGESLAILRRKLQIDQSERERLAALAEELEVSKEDPEYLEKAKQINAEWLKRLNVPAQKVGTLRKKISGIEKQNNPDDLGFHEKLHMFEKAAIEEGELPKIPVIEEKNPTSEFAVKAKETAFGAVATSDDDENSNK